MALIRVSKVGARGDDLISPDLQRSAIIDYAARHGIQVVEWVEALDESASQNTSPWWRRLDAAVEQVEAGLYDTVLTWKLSRTARHRRRWAVALDRVETAGGTIESATEGLDTSTSTGRFTRGMLAEIAAWEAERIGEQWKETQARRLRNGLPHSGTPRFGYAYSRADGYQPDVETGPLLADLYRRYVAGEGFTALTDWLNRYAIPTGRGGEWRHSRLRYLLDSGFAAGLIPVGRAPAVSHLPGAHPALIDAKLWQAYQHRREAQRRLPARLRAPRWPLSGLLRCEACGGNLEAYSKPGRDGPVGMYRCSTYTNKGRSACRGVWVRRDQAERFVLDWLAPWADDIDRLAAAAPTVDAARSRARADQTRLTRELSRHVAEAERMTQAVAQGLPMGDYLAWRAGHDARVAELERLLASAELDAVELRRPSAAQVRSLLAGWEKLTTARRRELLGRMVGAVVASRSEQFRGPVRLRVVPRWEVFHQSLSLPGAPQPLPES